MSVTGGKLQLLRPVTFDSGMISIGDVATLNAFPNGAIAVGAGASTDAFSSVILGRNTLTAEGAGDSVVIGPDSFARQGSTFAVVLGNAASAVTGSPYSVVVGKDALASDGNVGSVVIGTDARAYNGGRDNIVIGHLASLGGDGSSTYNIVIGYSSIAMGDRCVMIGSGTSTGPNHPTQVIAIGPDAIAGTIILHEMGISDGIAIGHGAWTSDNESVALGSLSRANGFFATAIGYQSLSEDGLSVAIGYEASVSTGLHSARCTAIGYQAKCDGSLEDNVVIGAGAEISGSTFASVVIGGLASAPSANNGSVVIGYQSGPLSAGPAGPSSVILLGANAHTGSSKSIVINTSPGFPSPSNVSGTGSDLAAAIGFSMGIGNSPGTFAMGTNSYAIQCNYGFLAGHLSHMGWWFNPLLQYPLAIGYQVVIDDPTSAGADIGDSHVAVGVDISLLSGSDGTTVLGRDTAMYGEDSIIVGNGHWIANHRFFVFGIECLSDAGPVSNDLSIGHHIYSVSNDCISMGIGAISQVQSLVIGNSTYLPAGASAIHKLTIKGYNGGALDTLVASDSPAVAGQVGLNVVLNTGVGFVNKDIHGATVPPPGALLLHVAP